ncbi:MAG TPA: Fe3+-hydroxamate ABC transporter substrate-binding protein [Thalassospira sp.]|nr:Fe3+-hydroxamate ABC transporter substrate-binding protein [Thalassospira sp.]
MKTLRTCFLILLGMLVAVPIAKASSVTVNDIAGRSVAVELPVKRVVVSEARYIPLLALLRPDDPVGGIVGTMTPLNWTHPELEAQLFEQHPNARDIPLFGGQNKDSVSVEKIIDLAPELAIFGLNDHGPGAKNAELIDQLTAAGTKIVFIDFRSDPLHNTLPSIRLLGRLLGAEKRAEEYAEFYQTRFDRVVTRVSQIEQRPSVFLQAHPGRFECCWGMADGMLGPFIEIAGGANIADAVAPGPTAQHTAEFLLTENPDVWIGTASGTFDEFTDGAEPVALGAGMTSETASQSLTRYLSAPEFAALDAVRNGRAHSIWHNFYNSPFNIVALEAFAKWIHPEIFNDIDPMETLAEIYDRWLPFELNGTFAATVGTAQ